MTKFSELAQAFNTLENLSSRTEMVAILSELFHQVKGPELVATVYLTQARLGPEFSAPDFNINEQLTIQALSEASGHGTDEIVRLFHTTGDLGTTAKQLVHRHSLGFSITEVFDRLQTLAKTSGAGSQREKVRSFAELLNAMDGVEASCVIRIVLGRLRLGVGEAALMDALSNTFVGDSSLRPAIERAYAMTSDLGLVALVGSEKGSPGLTALKSQPGMPLRPELAERLPSAADIVKRLGKVWAEPKYDGIRLQVHRHGDDVHIFTRRLEDVTAMFPELVTAARQELTVSTAIIDGEAVVYNPDTAEFLPFQTTAQRRRVHNVAAMSERYPLRLFAFDLLNASGQDLTDRPLMERHHRLEKIIRAPDQATIVVSSGLLTSDPKALEVFFEQQLADGHEGIVAKQPQAPYHAGSRGYDWIKLKRAYQAKLKDTVDTVLVGYIIGKGQRAKFGIGSLLSAIYDPQNDRFRTVGKIGSGLSDENWVKLKALLDRDKVDHKPTRVDAALKPDVWVEPHYVVEVYADQISRSPIHTAGKTEGHSGYALRFPRMVGWIRMDKRPEDATTEDEIIKLYQMQKRPRQQPKSNAA